ncbi:hypothetical protein [Pseudomonas salomonii]|uniref:hypothetical protein n=1 Tax=Pseudomonas salomonii TaxID=191391 RepID=UPI001C431352|nr:hypothetical protein [Pseudomonas salomonii]
MKRPEVTSCTTTFEVFTKHRAVFAERFDDIVYSCVSEILVYGRELRNISNGCELNDAWGRGWMCHCRTFDEQLQFVSDIDECLSNTRYRLTLSTGQVIRGATDANGYTERIRSHTATTLDNITFYRNTAFARGCAGVGVEEEEEEEEEEEGISARNVSLRTVQTSQEDFGLSSKKVVLKNDVRGLTSAEIAACNLLFGKAVNYEKVKVHGREYLLFGLQPDDTAMTPNGELYFNPKHYRQDYTAASNSVLHWFMHEMVHVWQYQLGYPVKTRGAVRLGLDYSYTLKEGRRLRDFNMEAQGDVLADYFILKFKAAPAAMSMKKYATSLTLYEDVLSDFLKDPSSPDNLPPFV